MPCAILAVKKILCFIKSCDERMILLVILGVLCWYCNIHWLALLPGRPLTALGCSRLRNFVSGGTTVAGAPHIPYTAGLLPLCYFVKRRF